MQHTHAKEKIIPEMATPHAASSQRTHVSRAQECALTRPVTRRAPTQYLHTQNVRCQVSLMCEGRDGWPSDLGSGCDAGKLKQLPAIQHPSCSGGDGCTQPIFVSFHFFYPRRKGDNSAECFQHCTALCSRPRRCWHAFACLPGPPSIRGCSACGPGPILPWRACLRLIMFCTRPPLCAGVLWPMPAWVWRDVRSVFFCFFAALFAPIHRGAASGVMVDSDFVFFVLIVCN